MPDESFLTRLVRQPRRNSTDQLESVLLELQQAISESGDADGRVVLLDFQLTTVASAPTTWPTS